MCVCLHKFSLDECVSPVWLAAVPGVLSLEEKIKKSVNEPVSKLHCTY